MTIVNFDVKADSAVGLTTADGSILCTPWPGYRVEGTTLIAPEEFKVPISESFSIDLAPTTDATWCWWIMVQTRRGGRGYYVLVPASGPVNFTELTHVDPRTLEPTATPEAAWWSALQEALDDKVTNAGGVAAIWSGTQAAYDELDPKSPTTLYVITED